jgi:hypothetical protein
MEHIMPPAAPQPAASPRDRYADRVMQIADNEASDAGHMHQDSLSGYYWLDDQGEAYVQQSVSDMLADFDAALILWRETPCGEYGDEAWAAVHGRYGNDLADAVGEHVEWLESGVSGIPALAEARAAIAKATGGRP